MELDSSASSVMDGQDIKCVVSEPKSSTQSQPQPQPQPWKQPRRPSKYEPKRVMDDIMEQSREKGLRPTDGYSLGISTVEQQAEKFPDFVGNADFYLLDKAKAVNLIHGEYVIVYARPVAHETNLKGKVVCETFDPNDRNTICIFSKRIEEKTRNHRKINELLDNDLLAVGMVYYKSWNMTLWLTKDLDDSNTTSKTRAWSPFKDRTNAKAPEPQGDLEKRLWNGPIHSATPDARVSFGATSTVDIVNMDNRWINHGFEFVSVEFPSYDQDTGVVEDFMIVAAKMPHNKDVSSMFILTQKLMAPINTDCMVSFPWDNDKSTSSRSERLTKNGIGEVVSNKPLPSSSDTLTLGGESKASKDQKGKGKEVEFAEGMEVEESEDKKGKGKEVEVIEVMDVDDNSDADTIKS